VGGRQWWFSDCGIVEEPEPSGGFFEKFQELLHNTLCGNLLYDFYSKWFTDYALGVLKFVPICRYS
jgi:hypothetical protein